MSSAEDVSHVSPEFLRRVGETFAPVKARTYELMRVAPGQTVLDLGCGPGTDTIPLAGRVGPTGRVVGVDADAEMIGVADGRAAAQGLSDRVRHVRADAVALPLEAAHFDACRSERVFQHLPDPTAALAELRRVTKPGGRIVVADPDFCSMSIDTRETSVERKLFHAMAEIQQNGYSARRLYRLFREGGLGDVGALVMPIVFHGYDVLKVLLRVKLDDALRQAALAREDFDRMEKGIEEAVEAGAFFGSVNMVLVAGTAA